MKTVSELAKELGVSPQAIYKRINDTLKVDLNKHIQKDKRQRTVITTTGEELIKRSFEHVQTAIETDSNRVQTAFKEGLNEKLESVQNERLQEFKEQVDRLNKELENKQNTIESLQRQNEALIKQNENSQSIIFSMQKQQQVLIEAPGRKSWFDRFKRDKESEG